MTTPPAEKPMVKFIDIQVKPVLIEQFFDADLLTKRKFKEEANGNEQADKERTSRDVAKTD
jgi:hypothetical protein